MRKGQAAANPGPLLVINATAEGIRKPLLRFITCGGVDDGKSTLVNRFMREAEGVFTDQKQASTLASEKHGSLVPRIGVEPLVESEWAEREESMAVDVAYHFFKTKQRRFAVVDTPENNQYTRNMAAAASTAQLALILIDASKGVTTHTRLHSRIASLMGVRQVVLAINKMDLVNFDERAFDRINSDYEGFASELGFATTQVIPLSALTGDNISIESKNIGWYHGPTLLDYLNDVDVISSGRDSAFRMPVQWVNEPNADFRKISGRNTQGGVKSGDRILILPSGVESKVKSVVVWPDGSGIATDCKSITLTFNDAAEVCRGDVVVAFDKPLAVADQFEARLLWVSEQVLMPGRAFILKLHAKEVIATITEIKYREDVGTGAHLAAKTLRMDEIATVNLSLTQPVAFDSYGNDRILGGFSLIDQISSEVVGLGTIEFALRRSGNLHWQKVDLNKARRAAIKSQTPRCIWFTGLSGSGKSTIANLVEKQLYSMGLHTYILDGDNVRLGLNRDLGFSDVDRVENIRRVAEVARLMLDAGLIVLVSFISPFRTDRAMARGLFEPGEFIEVFVDTSLEECEARDPKGLYAKARLGDLKNFTGIDSPYESPVNPELHLRTSMTRAADLADSLIATLGLNS